MNLLGLDVVISLSLGQNPLLESEGKIGGFTKRTQVGFWGKENNDIPDDAEPALRSLPDVHADIAVLIGRVWDS